jgi:predicted ATPase
LPRETSFLRGFTEGTTFVGREAEHATLARCLEQALAGQGKIILIGGAAGVGKTRIAAEISEKASRRGMRAFVGSCYDREDPVPFNPVVEILEEWLAQTRDMTAFRLRWSCHLSNRAESCLGPLRI